MLNIQPFLFCILFSSIAMAMFYIRYKQIATYQKDCPVRIITRVNTTALVMGLFSAFGISLVGNFQVNENVNETHFTF